MLKRHIYVRGFRVDVYQFGLRQFLYPSFNHNAEFRANKEGFSSLDRYLREVLSIQHFYSLTFKNKATSVANNKTVGDSV